MRRKCSVYTQDTVDTGLSYFLFVYIYEYTIPGRQGYAFTVQHASGDYQSHRTGQRVSRPETSSYCVREHVLRSLASSHTL